MKRKLTSEERKATKEIKELSYQALLIGSDRSMALKHAIMFPALSKTFNSKKEIDSYNQRLEEIISRLTIINEQHKLIPDEEFEQKIFEIRNYGLEIENVYL